MIKQRLATSFKDLEQLNLHSTVENDLQSKQLNTLVKELNVSICEKYKIEKLETL